MSRTATLQPKAVEMVREGRAEALITGGILDGPLALDNAIDLTAAKIKKIPMILTSRADSRIARLASWRTGPVTSTRTVKSLSACRPTRRSSVPSCPSAAGVWSWQVSSLR